MPAYVCATESRLTTQVNSYKHTMNFRYLNLKLKSNLLFPMQIIQHNNDRELSVYILLKSSELQPSTQKTSLFENLLLSSSQQGIFLEIAAQRGKQIESNTRCYLPILNNLELCEKLYAS